MMMLSKRSFLATLAALTLSFGAGAMSQYGQDQQAKKILEVEQCDDEGQVGKGDECQDLSQKLSKVEVGQSGASCSSSQAQYGACVTQDTCTHQASKSDPFAQHVGPRQQVSSWYGYEQQLGQQAYYQNWNGSQWNGVRLEKSRFYHLMLKGAVLDNVWLSGYFTDLDFGAATVRNTTFSGEFRNTDFIGAKFENVVFDHAKFKAHHLHRSNFDGATMENVLFTKTKLKHMTFRGAVLKNVQFECSQIKDWNCFKHAKVWVGDRYVKLNSDILKGMGAKIKDCRSNMIDLAALLH